MDKYYAILSKVCAWTLFAMTILGALNAILRYSSRFTGQVWSSNAFLEGQWYLFSTIFLLGAGYTLYKDKHVRVDVLYSRLSKTGQNRINVIGTLVFAIPFCILGLWSSVDFVYNSWAVSEMSADAGGLPRYPVKTLIPLGFLLLLLQCLVWLKRLLFTSEEGVFHD